MAKLTQEDWAAMKEIGDRMDEILRSSDPVACVGGKFVRVSGRELKGKLLIPECCIVGMEGYDEMIELRRKKNRIKKGRGSAEEEN